MTESEALSKMIAPGQPRPGKMRQGVIQIMITRACDKACYHCTQNSQLSGKPVMMTPEQFEQACLSLRGYWGVVGVFGGNPAMSLYFEEICAILRKHFPFEQRGLWCNHPRGKGKAMRETFNPAVSNLNVHLDREAWDEFKRDWPESRPFGLDTDSRHSPCFVGMKDIGVPEEKRWELISNCDINQHWSALIGVFRSQLRAYFCEIAYAQAILHERDVEWVDDALHHDNPEADPKYTYPDTGLDPTRLYKHITPDGVPHSDFRWWQLGMECFRDQVRQHCHNCGVPLRGYGELAMANDDSTADLLYRPIEQVSRAHSTNYHPKVKGRLVELVLIQEQLGQPLKTTIDYVGNARKPKSDICQ